LHIIKYLAKDLWAKIGGVQQDLSLIERGNRKQAAIFTWQPVNIILF